MFDRIVAKLTGKLLVLLTSLLSTISSLDPKSKNYDVLMGRTTDHHESVSIKVGQLVSLQHKLDIRLTSLARKDGFCSVNPVNKTTYTKERQPDKIILGGSSSGVSIYFPATGKIFKGQETAGSHPDPPMPVEAPQTKTDPREQLTRLFTPTFWIGQQMVRCPPVWTWPLTTLLREWTFKTQALRVGRIQPQVRTENPTT